VIQFTPLNLIAAYKHHVLFQPVSTAMGDHTEALPFIVTSSRPLKWRQRLFAVSYAGAVAVAMIGWCTALGWAAISLIGRMLS
jgi:hypothetical protein